MNCGFMAEKKGGVFMNKADTEKILKFYPHIDDDIRMCKASLAEYEERYNIIGAITYDGIDRKSVV